MDELIESIASHANPQKAALLGRFFKTGRGEYGEGDIFLGIMVPVQRKIAKQFSNLSLPNCLKLLSSSYHEYRLIALFILIEQFRKGDEIQKKNIFDLYMDNTRFINNWDLVDLSAPRIVGGFLFDKDYDDLYVFAKSNSLWKKRIAMIASFTDLKYGRYDRTLLLAEMLLHDTHDLIHKAVGWMLREMGKRGGIQEEKQFLTKYSAVMPRTMLRYAIERFPEQERLSYLIQKRERKPISHSV